MYTIIKKNIITIAEEVILAEERTTEAQRFHIIDARRRAATKMRKLKTLGRSHDKEDDTEEEPDESCKYFCLSTVRNIHTKTVLWNLFRSIIFANAQTKKIKVNQTRGLPKFLGSGEAGQVRHPQHSEAAGQCRKNII